MKTVEEQRNVAIMAVGRGVLKQHALKDKLRWIVHHLCVTMLVALAKRDQL